MFAPEPLPPAVAARAAALFPAVGALTVAEFAVLGAWARRDPKAAARGGLVALGVWLAVDTASGLVNHAGFNALYVNLPCALALVPPLAWASRRA